MRLLLKILLCLGLAPAAAVGQERITQALAGPADEGYKTVVAFIEPGGPTYKMQSMIVETTAVKSRRETPKNVLVDLTSTARTFATGAKYQKILHLRWGRAGEIEFRCDGKWKKQAANAAAERIVDAVKALFEIIPLDARGPTELTLPESVEEKILGVLNDLNRRDFPCLRELN